MCVIIDTSWDQLFREDIHDNNAAAYQISFVNEQCFELQ